MVSSRAYPSLERKPGGPDNWVERAGGLPSYIERIAKHLHYEQGKSISHSIAAAVNTVKRWALGGTVTKYGTTKRITPKTQALAARAVAEWEAKKKAGSLNLTDGEFMVIELTMGYDTFAFDLLDLADAEVEDTDTMVAIMIPEAVASELAVEGGVPVEDMHITLAFFKDIEDAEFDKLVEEVKEFCASAEPFEVKVGGLGNFEAKDPEKGTPYFAEVTGDGKILEFQTALAEFIDYESDYDTYTPHVTLSYVKEGEAPPEAPASHDVAINAVWVVRGNKQRVQVPFGAGAGVDLTEHGTLSAMDIEAWADRANAIVDPEARGLARAKVLNLAAGRTLTEGTTIDLASTIPPRNARGRASDGRKSFSGQGKFKHGFIPVNQAAKEAKAKGSPIAMKRMKRLFGADKAADDPRTKTREVTSPSPIPSKVAKAKYDENKKTLKDTATSKAKTRVAQIAHTSRKREAQDVEAATGRAGQRSDGGRKRNPGDIKINEKSQSGAEGAQDIGFLRNTQIADSKNVVKHKDGSSQQEASKESRIPERARQNWDEIPETLKTVRNGKKYVVAEFAGKQYVTEWIGGIRESDSTPLAKRKVMASLTTADASNMPLNDLRALVNNPQTPQSVKKVARAAARAKGKSVG